MKISFYSQVITSFFITLVFTSISQACVSSSNVNNFNNAILLQLNATSDELALCNGANERGYLRFDVTQETVVLLVIHFNSTIPVFSYGIADDNGVTAIYGGNSAFINPVLIDLQLEPGRYVF
jgi:hypothetical protein